MFNIGNYILMCSVSIRSVALYAISDHVSRKSPFEFGVLLGDQSSNKIHIFDAFELKTNGETIDFEYFEKRLCMILAVSQNALLVGLYTTNERNVIPESFWDQFSQRTSAIPPIYLIVKENKVECYCSQSREEIELIIAPGETEEIATETIHSHKNYNSDVHNLNTESKEALLESLEHLRDRVVQILNEDTISAEEELKLVHLANIACEPPHHGQDESLLYISAKLALLTNELSAIKALDIVNSRKIAGYLIGVMKHRPR